MFLIASYATVSNRSDIQSVEYFSILNFLKLKLVANADVITFAMSICYTFIFALGKSKNKYKIKHISGDVYLRFVQCNKIFK